MPLYGAAYGFVRFACADALESLRPSGVRRGQATAQGDEHAIP